MIGEYFRQLNNSSIVPLISLVVFFLSFVLLVFWTFTRKKNYLNHMKNLPLDNNIENKNSE
ncbi:MAG: cbb3-type cytochrome c oxidase subunit 3 [Melioribacteraceae bacterium]|nr:cbb3-type cytochrome c oxidase subunit 3 [Melioribacteraceae bacterium]